MPNSHSVEFELTEQDVLDFKKAHALRNLGNRPNQSREKLFLYFVLPCLLLYSAYNGLDLFTFPKGALPFIFFGAVVLACIVFIFCANRRATRQMLDDAKQRGFFHKQRLEINAEGVENEGQNGNSFTKWEGVFEVVSFPSLVAIYHSKQIAMIIPRRAFASDFECEQFIRSAESFHHTAIAKKTINSAENI